MVAVIDTNIIMNAAFDQLNHEDCSDQAIYDCIEQLIKIIEPNCIDVNVTSNLKVCIEDPNDDKLVNLAKDGNSEFIITNNLGHFHNAKRQKIKNNCGQIIKIMTPYEFIIAHTQQQHYRITYNRI
jgi:predicted nucleic acid-binding protein